MLAMERSLLVILPDAVQHKDAILPLLESQGFYIMKAEETYFTKERAEEYYQDSLDETSAMRHMQSKADYLSAGRSFCIVMAKTGAVNSLLLIAGPADPVSARETNPHSLRALYGKDRLRNAVSVSTSVENATREISCVFPQPPLSSLSSDEYLKETVMPGLVEALADICHPSGIPADPYAALERWLLTHRPTSEGQYQHPVMEGHVLHEDDTPDELKSSLKIPGTANFRKVKAPLPLFGMAQCSSDGCELVAKHLLQNCGYTHVTFINVREEPVVYIGGKSYTIRDPNDPDRIVEHLSAVESFELAALERRLKTDIIATSLRKNGSISAFNSTGETSIPVDPDSVLPVAEMYEKLQQKVVNVSFLRIPVTAGSIPEDSDIAELVDVIRHLPAGACAVVECSSGVGRTSMMLTMAVCVWKILHGSPAELQQLMPGKETRVRGSFFAGSADREKAEFRVVDDVLATLGAGPSLKIFVDLNIELTNHLVDMRDSILHCLGKTEGMKMSVTSEFAGNPTSPTKANAPHEESGWVQRASIYLQRYCLLLVLSVYCLEQAPTFRLTYIQWIRQHWNVLRPLRQVTFE